MADPRRFADIYIFAHHPITDESADHRDPRQWRFYLVSADCLPPEKTISLKKITALTDGVPWADLGMAVKNKRKQ